MLAPRKVTKRRARRDRALRACGAYRVREGVPGFADRPSWPDGKPAASLPPPCGSFPPPPRRVHGKGCKHAVRSASLRDRAMLRRAARTALAMRARRARRALGPLRKRRRVEDQARRVAHREVRQFVVGPGMACRRTPGTRSGPGGAEGSGGRGRRGVLVLVTSISGRPAHRSRTSGRPCRSNALRRICRYAIEVLTAQPGECIRDQATSTRG